MRLCLFCVHYLNTASRRYIFLWENNIHSLHYIWIYTLDDTRSDVCLYIQIKILYCNLHIPGYCLCQDITKVKWITLTVPISTPKPSNLHSVTVSLIFQRSQGGSLPDACILERNGKLILWSLSISSNWMLFISWKDAPAKGSSLLAVAQFPSSMAVNFSPSPRPLMIKWWGKKQNKKTLVHFRCQ